MVCIHIHIFSKIFGIKAAAGKQGMQPLAR
jgi:hypothetical protein